MNWITVKDNGYEGEYVSEWLNYEAMLEYLSRYPEGQDILVIYKIAEKLSYNDVVNSESGKRARALAKLTDEEKRLLGVH